MAARTGPLLAPEKPRAGRGGVAAGVLAADWLWIERPGALLLGRPGADGDVLGHLLDHFDHRRPARRIPVVDAGFAGAAHQHGVGQDSGIGHAGLDSRVDFSVLRAFGGRAHRAARIGSSGAGDSADFFYTHRAGIRDRLEDGIHGWISCHYEFAAGADVHGLGIAVPDGHRARLGAGADVGQPADLFDIAVESHAGDAEYATGSDDEPAGDPGIRFGAAGGLGNHGCPEDHAQHGMKIVGLDVRRTPWSARDALVPQPDRRVSASYTTQTGRRGRRPRTRGSAPRTP